MSDLLPILQSESRGWMCDICPEPGLCCKEIHLYEDQQHDGQLSFWKDSWVADAKALMLTYDLPFEPLRIAAEYHDPDSGRDYVRILFYCPKLTSEGRCSIHNEWPNLCRAFRPGPEDRLCAFGRIR